MGYNLIKSIDYHLIMNFTEIFLKNITFCHAMAFQKNTRLHILGKFD